MKKYITIIVIAGILIAIYYIHKAFTTTPGSYVADMLKKGEYYLYTTSGSGQRYTLKKSVTPKAIDAYQDNEKKGTLTLVGYQQIQWKGKLLDAEKYRTDIEFYSDVINSL